MLITESLELLKAWYPNLYVTLDIGGLILPHGKIGFDVKISIFGENWSETFSGQSLEDVMKRVRESQNTQA